MAATTAGGEVVTVSHMFDAGHRDTGSRGTGHLQICKGLSGMSRKFVENTPQSSERCRLCDEGVFGGKSCYGEALRFKMNF